MQGTTAPRAPDVDAAQEIADLKAKLANITKAHDALIEANKQAQKTIDRLRDEADELEDELEEARANPLQEDEINDLARARSLLKAGNSDAAREELERILDRLDGCWRTRAATVVSQEGLAP